MVNEDFNEHSWKAEEISNIIEVVMIGIEKLYRVQFLELHHDVARRFLNMIVEYKPGGE